MFDGGYKGRLLRINLDHETTSVQMLDEELVRDFMGGRGLGDYFLFKELHAGVPPFSPESKICFLTGPLQGTAAPFAPKFVIVNKSPLSGALSRSVCGGGAFGPELKYAGYDGLIIEGKAEGPVYLWIDDENVQIRDARAYWGKTTGETEAGIRKELGDDSIKIVPIGPAGENRVRFAGVIPESRAAGRGGGGAVMGSKNLKAIAVRGTGTVHVADPTRFRILLEETYEVVRKHPGITERIAYGTPLTVKTAYEAGVLPVMNFSRGRFDGIHGLLAETIKEKLYLHNEACFGCPVPCGKMSLIRTGPYRGTTLQGPHYETIGLLGSNCGVDDIIGIARVNYLCNQYGLDTISTGNVIAFAMECYEKGLLGRVDTDGLELKWGDVEVMLALIEKIAKREGFGDLLAEGTGRASEKIGKESAKFAMHSKGQEFAAFEPRSAVGMGLVFATSTPGANHCYGPTYRAELLELKDLLSHRGKASICRKAQNDYCLQDSMVLCSFSRYGFDNARRFQFVEAVTGRDFSERAFTRLADRIYTLERLFNVREGLTKNDDALPWRSLREPMPDGPSRGNTVPLEPMLRDYYRVRGWDETTGVPRRETLRQLGIAHLGADIVDH